MGATDAERQRRARAHRAGDHSMCRPGGPCPFAPATEADEAPVTVTPVTPTRDVTLGTRGQRLWDAVTAAGALDPTRVVLLEEACRIADRLDQLDAVLTGRSEAWMHLQASEDGSEVTVVVDKALSEARQQAAVLKTLVAELRPVAGKPQPTGQPAPTGPEKGGGSVVHLADRLASLRPPATG